jgi:hypothetical protein
MSRDITRRPQQDSNLRTRLRRAVLYPLSYGGWRICSRPVFPGWRSKGTRRKYPRTRTRCARMPCR